MTALRDLFQEIIRRGKRYPNTLKLCGHLPNSLIFDFTENEWIPTSFDADVWPGEQQCRMLPAWILAAHFWDFFNSPFHVICCSPKRNEYQAHQVVCGLRKNATNEGTKKKKKKVAIAFHFYAGWRVWDQCSYINNCIELWWWNTKKQREEVWISRELLSQSAWWY